MISAPPPQDEPERIRTLHLYRVLDTASEEAYDALTRLAASLCDTPIALVSLVDSQRQWFKSRVGLDVAETPRDLAFCAHAILQDGPMVVEDAQADPRFADNPLVDADPNIRFYAGMPLKVASGQSLGTLCVIDRRPRKLTDQQLETLQVLGQAVVCQLELRRAIRDLEDVQKLLPMCAWCRSVRQDNGSWVSLDHYVSEAIPLTHGICPDCVGTLRHS